MKNFERIVSLSTLILFLCCGLQTFPANAQSNPSPPIVVGVSINESGSPVVNQDWPMLVSVNIMNENAYQSNVLPISLTPAWKNSIHFIVRNAQGEIVSWPFHLIPKANENIVLDSLNYARVGFYLESNETNQILAGQYILTAVLDSSAYPGLGSNLLSARSGLVGVTISNNPGSLTTLQKTDKDLLLTNLNILKDDDQNAMEYLSGILGYNPTNLRALSLTGYLLEKEADYGGALYAYSKGLDIFYKENPGPVEPPLELLKAQKSLLYKLDTSTSFVVTLAPKDSIHPAYKLGSQFAYYVDNIPARDLYMERGKTYTFYLQDIPATDSLYFSTSAIGGGQEPYTDGVNGAPVAGNDTATITIGDNTPDVLYYQSLNNEFVGWKITILEHGNLTSVPEIKAKQLKGYSLSSAYPNPINSTTRIHYSLPKAGNVRLTILDIQGREVEILVNDNKAAGSYEVQWNPQLPGGIYFYQIQVGEFKDKKKILILR